MATLRNRVLGNDWRVSVIAGVPGFETAHLPGRLMVLGQELVERLDSAESLAGWMLAEALAADAHDPLLDALHYAGIRATFTLMTTGTMLDGALSGYAAQKFRVPSPIPTAQDIGARFDEIGQSPTAYALSLPPRAAGLAASLAAHTVPADRQSEQLLSDGEWLDLAGNLFELNARRVAKEKAPGRKTGGFFVCLAVELADERVRIAHRPGAAQCGIQLSLRVERPGQHNLQRTPAIRGAAGRNGHPRGLQAADRGLHIAALAIGADLYILAVAHAAPIGGDAWLMCGDARRGAHGRHRGAWRAWCGRRRALMRRAVQIGFGPARCVGRGQHVDVVVGRRVRIGTVPRLPHATTRRLLTQRIGGVNRLRATAQRQVGARGRWDRVHLAVWAVVRAGRRAGAVRKAPTAIQGTGLGLVHAGRRLGAYGRAAGFWWHGIGRA